MSKRPQSVGAMAKASAFAAVGYCVDYTFQLVDMFWLAKLGPSVPTALTTVTVYVFIAMALNEVVGSGSVSVISQAIRAGDRQDAQAKILKCLLLKLGLGSCLLAPIFLAIVWLDAAFIDKDAQIQKHIWSYAAVIWMSLIIIPVYTTLMTVMRAAAMGGPATFASLIALVINFCITPILVFGWFGAPELGVAGGALGAVFAQLATLVLCVFFIIRQRPDLLPARWPLPAIDHTLYRRIVMIGIPVGVTMLIFQIEAAILVGYLHSYSVAQSDGFGVGLRLMNAVYSINVGLTVGAGVVTGNMIGAGSQTRLRSDTIIFVMAVMGASVILAASSAYWAETIARQFVTDENAVHFAVQFIQYALVANIAFAGAHVIIGAFEGRGMTLPVLISMLVAYVAIEFPLLFLAQRHFAMQQEFLWSAMIVATATAFLLLCFFFFRAKGDQPQR